MHEHALPACAVAPPIPRHGVAVLVALTALAALGHSAPAKAQSPVGVVGGVVVDATTEERLAGAQVRIRGLGRSDLSHGDGTFHLDRVPAGRHVLAITRLGYATKEREIEVAAGETLRLRIALEPSAIALPGVVVTGGRERGLGETYQPTTVLAGAELSRRLATSVAATIAHEPGISQRQFGPAPAQPVIRGMTGDRVLVLEDGQRTGDLAATAPDHAVAIDPVAAERIEVVRGPAGLLYGSNALGGVVNVVREEVPRNLPHHRTGIAALHAESVNRGVAASASVRAPLLGRVAVRAEAGARGAGDVRTPLGPLPSTNLAGRNLALSASLVPGWGYVGFALRDYALDYGLPGEFDGELIPGAHPGGVEAETRRRAARLEAGHFAGLGPFSALELNAGLTWYVHDEIEGEIPTPDGPRRILGARFDQLTSSANVVARHSHENGMGRLEGAFGVSILGRDLLTEGSFPGSRSANELALAAYGYEELAFGSFRFQLGARYDRTRIRPYSEHPIRIGDREVPVRPRRFGDFSLAGAVLHEVAEGWKLGLNVARAFRTPSIQELYSDGPHLADFSFDVGNPELGSETGLGVDLFARIALPRLEAEAALFRNAVSNFIYYMPTGDVDHRFHRFPVFEARGDDALFQGAEARFQWEALRNLVVDGTVSAVRGTRVAEGDPLPAMPPLNGGIRLRYDVPRFFLTAAWEGAVAQRRLPRPIPSPIRPGETIEPERPTGGYGLVDLGAGLRWSTGTGLHMVTLRIDNLFDRVWRDHLSRVKDVAPQPGRNLQLLYRLQF